jgi:diadenylate cyclase
MEFMLFGVFSVLDALDILLVAVLLYQGYKLVSNTRAINLVRGLIVFGLVLYAANRLELRTISFILSQLATVGLFALVVVFQPELRAVLERIGRGRVREPAPTTAVVGELSRAIERLAERRVGALIALERRTPLGEYASTGTRMDAEVSASLLETVFARNTPLHDGGVIVHHGRVIAAGCVFPLSSLSESAYRRLGTRHRSAIGLSEISDAMVIVVSEERGSIRIASGGQLSPDLNLAELRERLREGAFETPVTPMLSGLLRNRSAETSNTGSPAAPETPTRRDELRRDEVSAHAE